MWQCLYVGLGGFIGSVLRYLLTLLPITTTTQFPYPTLLINVLGGLAIGAFRQVIELNFSVSPALIFFVQVGICGGFTTFSTFALETFDLMQNGKYIFMLLYILASLILCVTAVWLGKWGIKALLT